jgi:hypothetical protein
MVAVVVTSDLWNYLPGEPLAVWLEEDHESARIEPICTNEMLNSDSC